MNWLNSLSKSKKLLITFIIFWTAFIVLRTAFDLNLVGNTYYSLDEDEFFVNWLLPIFFVSTAYKAAIWILADKNIINTSIPLTKPRITTQQELFENFERKISHFSKETQLNAVALSGLLMEGNKDAYELHKTLKPNIVAIVISFVKESNDLLRENRKRNDDRGVDAVNQFQKLSDNWPDVDKKVLTLLFSSLSHNPSEEALENIIQRFNNDKRVIVSDFLLEMKKLGQIKS